MTDEGYLQQHCVEGGRREDKAASLGRGESGKQVSLTEKGSQMMAV